MAVGIVLQLHHWLEEIDVKAKVMAKIVGS